MNSSSKNSGDATLKSGCAASRKTQKSLEAVSPSTLELTEAGPAEGHGLSSVRLPLPGPPSLPCSPAYPAVPSSASPEQGLWHPPSALLKQRKELRGDKVKSTQRKQGFPRQETTCAYDVGPRSPGVIHRVSKSPRGTESESPPLGTVHTGLGLSAPTAALLGEWGTLS